MDRIAALGEGEAFTEDCPILRVVGLPLCPVTRRRRNTLNLLTVPQQAHIRNDAVRTSVSTVYASPVLGVHTPSLPARSLGGTNAIRGGRLSVPGESTKPLFYRTSCRYD